MMRSMGLVLGVLVAAPAAVAQQAQAGDAEAARAAFARGVEHMDERRWQQALDAFEESIAARPTQVAILNAGRCLESLHRPREALAIYERFLANFRTQTTAQRRDHAEARIAELRAVMGSLRIVVSQPGAEVSVDGEALGSSPFAEAVMLPAGAHAVEARLPGRPVATATPTIRAGEASEVSLTLEQPVASERELATARASEQEPATARQPEPVVAGQGLERSPEPAATAPREGLARVWFLAAASLAAAGAVATGVMGTLAIVRNDEYQSSYPRTLEGQQAGKDLVQATDIAFGITLAAAALAVVLFTQTDFGPPGTSNEHASALRLGSALGPGSVGVVGATF